MPDDDLFGRPEIQDLPIQDMYTGDGDTYAGLGGKLSWSPFKRRAKQQQKLGPDVPPDDGVRTYGLAAPVPNAIPAASIAGPGATMVNPPVPPPREAVTDRIIDRMTPQIMKPSEYRTGEQGQTYRYPNAGAEERFINTKLGEQFQTDLLGYEGSNMDKETGEHTPYRDMNGYATGYGHKLTEQDFAELGIDPNSPTLDEDVKALRVSDEQARKWFNEDSQKAYQAGQDLLKQHNIDASPELSSLIGQMAYQMGGEGAGKFEQMLKAIQSGDMTGAAREMIQNTDGSPTKWHSQSPKRAEELSARMAALAPAGQRPSGLAS